MKTPGLTARAAGGYAVCLALAAGYVDGYALRALGTYVSFMSGNTTQGGLKSGQGQWQAALTPGVAVLCFVGGVFAGTLLAHVRQSNSRRLLLVASAVLMALYILLDRQGGLGINKHIAFQTNIGVALLSASMGLLNPTLSRIGAEAVSLTFVTGTLNKIGDHLALAVCRVTPSDAQGAGDTHLRRAGIEASLWGAFLGGAVLSGLLSTRLEALALAPPLVALALLAALTRPPRTAATI